MLYVLFYHSSWLTLFLRDKGQICKGGGQLLMLISASKCSIIIKATYLKSAIFYSLIKHLCAHLPSYEI